MPPPSSADSAARPVAAAKRPTSPPAADAAAADKPREDQGFSEDPFSDPFFSDKPISEDPWFREQNEEFEKMKERFRSESREPFSHPIFKRTPRHR